MIKHKSFSHGWWYHYRLHEDKSERLCDNGLAPLKLFLDDVFTNCPDEKFLTGPRSSKLRVPLIADVKDARGHEVCSLAKRAHAPRTMSRHSTVEMHMLERDTKSLAVEVPLWLDMHEHELMTHCDEPGPLSGHIDVLRVDDGKVWVWDYKPNAAKEKHAALQVYAYAVMLSQRTNLPLDSFRCGWFDEKDAFLFDPKTARLVR